MMRTVVIAGGTGLIGRQLESLLASNGFKVLILTRSPQRNNHIYWDPVKNKIDTSNLHDVEVIVNLTGAGIADKRWTNKRKKELHDSRIEPANFLYRNLAAFPNVKHYVSASGINCYGYKSIDRAFVEFDPYGDDYLSQLVKSWEEGSDLFSKKGVTVSKVRIAMVLSSSGGALDRLKLLAKYGMAAPLGDGSQEMCWIHEHDLVRLFYHIIANQIEGTWNALNGYTSNKVFMQTLSQRFGRAMWLPKVPRAVIQLILGEMSEMLLKGVPVSNLAIQETGFEFRYECLSTALADLKL